MTEQQQIPLGLLIAACVLSLIIAMSFTYATFKFLHGVIGVRLFNLYAIFAGVYGVWFVWRCYVVLMDTRTSMQPFIINNMVFPALIGGGFIWGILWLDRVTTTIVKQSSFLDSAKRECDDKTQSLLGRLDALVRNRR